MARAVCLTEWKEHNACNGRKEFNFKMQLTPSGFKALKEKILFAEKQMIEEKKNYEEYKENIKNTPLALWKFIKWKIWRTSGVVAFARC